MLASVALAHQSLLIYREQDLRQRRDTMLLVFAGGKLLVKRCPDVLLPDSLAMRHLDEEMKRYSRSVQLQWRGRPAKRQSLGIESSASKGSSSKASPGKSAAKKK